MKSLQTLKKEARVFAPKDEAPLLICGLEILQYYANLNDIEVYFYVKGESARVLLIDSNEDPQTYFLVAFLLRVGTYFNKESDIPCILATTKKYLLSDTLVDIINMN